MDNNISNSQFGMTDEDVKAAGRQEFLLKIKSAVAAVAPAVVKVFSSIIYYLVRFIKAFVSTSIRMVMGKE